MTPYFWLNINRQVRPTAVTQVTIGIKYAVWNRARHLILRLRKHAITTDSAVLTGTTVTTYSSVLRIAWRNFGSVRTFW